LSQCNISNQFRLKKVYCNFAVLHLMIRVQPMVQGAVETYVPQKSLFWAS
jgi:hypothetical protein